MPPAISNATNATAAAIFPQLLFGGRRLGARREVEDVIGEWLRTGVSFQPFQVGPDFGRALVAQVAVFFEQLVYNFLKLRRNIRIQSNHCHWLAVQNRVEDNG